MSNFLPISKSKHLMNNYLKQNRQLYKITNKDYTDTPGDLDIIFSWRVQNNNYATVHVVNASTFKPLLCCNITIEENASTHPPSVIINRVYHKKHHYAKILNPPDNCHCTLFGSEIKVPISETRMGICSYKIIDQSTVRSLLEKSPKVPETVDSSTTFSMYLYTGSGERLYGLILNAFVNRPLRQIIGPRSKSIFCGFAYVYMDPVDRFQFGEKVNPFANPILRNNLLTNVLSYQIFESREVSIQNQKASLKRERS